MLRGIASIQSNVAISGGTIDGTVIGGTTAAAVTGTTVTATTKFLAADGSAGLPSYSFSSSTAVGVRLAGAGSTALRWDYGGSNNVLSFSSNGLTLPPGQLGTLQWTATDASTLADTGFSRLGAASLALGNGTAADFSGALKLTTLNVVTAAQMNGTLLASKTAPTISSGFGTTPSIASNNGTATFRIDVGTGGTASSGVIGLPTAANGWNCIVDLFNPNATAILSRTIMTASTTSSVTIQNELISTGAATAWQASQVLIVMCFAY